MAVVKDHAGELPGAVDYRDYVSKEFPTIIQIGANDGVVGEEYGFQELLETIEKFRLILVEPLSPYFDNLVNVYGKYGDMVSYCKHVISDVNGKVSMVEHGCMSRIEPIGPIVAQSKTWDKFISDMMVKSIDLLILDCEGYEFQILQSIDFSKMSPKVIRYEYKHIPNKEACDDFLVKQGYKIEYCNHDHTYNKIAIL